MLQQEGSSLQSAQSNFLDSASDQQNSVFLSKPSAITSIDTGIVSSQSLPAVDTSFNPNTVSLSTSSSVNRVSTLDRNTALFAAFGLSLILTLAVSLPFLVPSLRRGRILDMMESDQVRQRLSSGLEKKIYEFLQRILTEGR